MLVDWHCHWVSPDLVAYLRHRKTAPCLTTKGQESWSLVMPRGTLTFDSRDHDPEVMLRQLRGSKVGHQVLSLPGLFGVDTLPSASSVPLLQDYNDNLAELTREFPQAFSALAALPLDDLEAACSELERVLVQPGILGAILPVDAFRHRAAAEVTRPLLDILNRHEAHLLIHPGPWPGFSAPSSPVDPDDSPLNASLRHTVLGVQAAISEAMLTLCLTDFLAFYPNISVQMTNLGGTLPFLVERMDHLQELRAPESAVPSQCLRRLYVDTATFGPRAISLAADVFGVDRLLFGSDSPIFSRQRNVDGLVESGLQQSTSNASLQLLSQHRGPRFE